MHIECDHCGAEILEEDALTHEADESIYYFCSLECLEAKGYSPDREAEAEGRTEPASSR